MPLPENNTPWPPKGMAKMHAKMAEWDAWYVGTPDALVQAYSRSDAPRTRPSQHAGGVTGAVARFLWGRPVPQGQRDGRLHVPVASDLAQASADLLYAEPPKITSAGGTATNDRLEEYLDDTLVSVLSGGAEVGAALGGRFHRVSWDREVSPDRAFLSTVHADAAIPEFRWGRLVAVTFWHVVDRDGRTVLRHLERHELDSAGLGLVLHGLYRGTDDNLGRAVPLTEHRSVAHLAKEVADDTALAAGRTPGLAVAYVPNITPSRAWRTDPVGKDLGRSDFEGVEGLMDALDEVYSSWMRDVRVAKSRILVPEYMTKTSTPGQGVTFDLDREAYTTIKAADSEAGDATITPMQFAIRVDEHQRTAQDIVEQILRSAGYSASTFGEDEDGAAATATETNARRGRSLTTRGRKVRLERPALAALATKLLYTDMSVFNKAGLEPTLPVEVDFGNTVQDSPLQLAQTVLALRQAAATSVETRVQMVHPEWTETQVTEEAQRIMAEESMGPAADPTSPRLFG